MKEITMSIRSNIIEADPVLTKNERVRVGKNFTRSSEYEVIAKLVMQQYQHENIVRFDLLFAIPPTDRVPALTEEYGKIRMHQLMLTLLKEFCICIPLAKNKKLNDTRINVCACDLMLTALENDLTIEDFILFFERAKEGKYGAITKFLTHQLIKEKLKLYMDERDEALKKIAVQKTKELKVLGSLGRIEDEPRQIGEIMRGAAIIDMNKKMSG
jgi:hypothetical protein